MEGKRREVGENGGLVLTLLSWRGSGPNEGGREGRRLWRMGGKKRKVGENVKGWRVRVDTIVLGGRGAREGRWGEGGWK